MGSRRGEYIRFGGNWGPLRTVAPTKLFRCRIMRTSRSRWQSGKKRMGDNPRRRRRRFRAGRKRARAKPKRRGRMTRPLGIRLFRLFPNCKTQISPKSSLVTCLQTICKPLFIKPSKLRRIPINYSSQSEERVLRRQRGPSYPPATIYQVL